MNLKNSKFYKRIQELRHFSKDKIRKDREQRSRVVRHLDMALSEQPCSDREWFSPGQSPSQQPASPRRRGKKIRGLKKKASAGKETDEISPYYGQSSGQNSPVPGAEAKLQGFIQLNNTTYRVECPTRLVNPPKNLDEERAARLSLLSVFL